MALMYNSFSLKRIGMFMKLRQMVNTCEMGKRAALVQSRCAGAYEDSFFTPFTSAEDAKRNIKAIAVRPIVDITSAFANLALCLSNFSIGLLTEAFGLLTLNSSDLRLGSDLMEISRNQLFISAYIAVSAITDCLDACARLLTHSMTTFGVASVNVIEDIVAPSQRASSLK